MDDRAAVFLKIPQPVTSPKMSPWKQWKEEDI